MARMDAFYLKLPPTDGEIAVLLDKYATEENAIYASHETVAEIVEALVKVAQDREQKRLEYEQKLAEHDRRTAELLETSSGYLDEARAARRAFRLLQEAHANLTVSFGRVSKRLKRMRRARGRRRVQ